MLEANATLAHESRVYQQDSPQIEKAEREILLLSQNP